MLLLYIYMECKKLIESKKIIESDKIIECEKCGKIFKYNYLLKRHLNNKNSCDNIHNILDILNIKIKEIENKIDTKNKNIANSKTKCYYCNNIFYKKSNLTRHVRDCCIIKSNLLAEKNKLFYEKEKAMQVLENKSNNDLMFLLKKENKELKTNITVNNNNNNNNNNIIINNNNLHININPFGEEDISHITDKDYKKFMTGFFPGFINFIKKIHYDDEMPSNHNIYISNIKSKFAYVFEDNKWNLKNKNMLVDKIITTKYNILDNKCDELEEAGLINDNIIDQFDEFKNNFINGGEETTKNVQNDIALLLYNNKQKVKKQIEI